MQDCTKRRESMVSDRYVFKTCPMCNYQWHSIEEFVIDLELRLEGYMADFGRPEDGLIVLTHTCPSCRSTMSITAGSFANWRSDPIITDLLFMSDECPGHCLNPNNTEACTVRCSMRWVRDVLQYLKAHKIPEHFVPYSSVKTNT